jgi:hypothetical protein
VESEPAAVPGYVNRPTGHTPACREPITATAEATGRRSRLRSALVALRAYEQRAEHRERMRVWLVAHAAQSSTGRPRTVRG